ncbi:TIGR02444 family protein [Halioxenophilus sp. WMMB6]|uniref:TIGR02444 family protein n=1 Tax=Halioxenophilus sp. WMMB6 TaxID=3073815 RepID=UPI00295F4DB4|nr:TIGR02444 family protein [Halioxenophilus sp. WMMB6]
MSHWSLTNPFWQFSLQRYAEPGVAQACLALQERLAVDINCLLLNSWLIATGRSLKRSDWQELLQVIEPWQQRIKRQRALRQRLKRELVEQPGGEYGGLYQRAKQLELLGEQYQQALMWQFSSQRSVLGTTSWQAFSELFPIAGEAELVRRLDPQALL